MKKIALPVFLLLLITAFSEKTVNNMNPFNWLTGTWTMKMKKGTIMESWQAHNDSTLLGESLMISLTGQSNVLENLKLSYQSGTYYYVSKVKGQNNGQEVKFTITSFSENGFVAENPYHDFPKRITYELINKDSIHAFIDGGVSMPAKRSDFYYSRHKN